jgi:hypothetical protein
MLRWEEYSPILKFNPLDVKLSTPSEELLLQRERVHAVTCALAALA